MNETEQMSTTDIEEALDNAWGEDDFAEPSAEREVQETSETKEGPAPADPKQKDQSETTAAPAADQQGAPELFTLRNRKETRQVTLEEMKALAQKNWDYDNVRSERDQLRQYKSEADPAYALVKSYAQKMNKSVPEYLDYCRQQELMQTGMNEQQATQAVQMEKRKAELDAQEARIKEHTAEREAAQQKLKEQSESYRRNMQEFLRVYPGVAAKDIPVEVWQRVKNGESMISAYNMHEIARLKAENLALRQNETNKKKTPGSLSANSGKDMDEMDRLWAQDDD